MFISYINCLYCFEYIKKPYLLGPFNGLIESQKKEKIFPVIAQEEYFNTTNGLGFVNIIPFPITNNFEDAYISRFESIREAWISLLRDEQQEYLNFLDITINNIFDECNERIEGVLTYFHCPSLHAVCKAKNIKIFEYETSPIRLPYYKFTLGYFTNDNKYFSRESKTRFAEFLQELSSSYITILSRKEILALVLTNENMNVLYDYNQSAEYDIAVALTINDDCYRAAWAEEDNSTLIEKAKSVFSNSILLRPHPWDGDEFEKYGLDIDKSSNSLQFIKKCKRVATIASNVGFEGMLLGKPTYILSDIAFSPGAMKSLDIDDDEVCGIEYINFITFCYFTPFELMHNVDYIRWRLTNPSELEIYNYNLNYILTEILKLDSDLLREPKGRLNRILIARGLPIYHYDKKSIDYTSDELWVKRQLAARDKEIFDLELKLAKQMAESR